MSKMTIGAVRIFVNNIERAKTFYADVLGLQLIDHAVDHGVLVLTDGNLDIVVERVTDAMPAKDKALVGRFTGISLSVDDIAHTCQHLTDLGVQFTGMPEKQYWGGFLATFCDSDDNEIQLVESAV